MMMARYLMVSSETHVIDNIIEWDGDAEHNPLELPDHELVEDSWDASPGWLWDGTRAIGSNLPAKIPAVPPGNGGMTINP